jgi:hypothetical protein
VKKARIWRVGIALQTHMTHLVSVHIPFPWSAAEGGKLVVLRGHTGMCLAGNINRILELRDDFLVVGKLT